MSIFNRNDQAKDLYPLQLGLKMYLLTSGVKVISYKKLSYQACKKYYFLKNSISLKRVYSFKEST